MDFLILIFILFFIFTIIRKNTKKTDLNSKSITFSDRINSDLESMQEKSTKEKKKKSRNSKKI